MKQVLQKGKVIFAGAGPGDPELITVKAVRFLQKADVIITDRLVSETILETYARKDALILHAGKQQGREGSTPQQVINELLVAYSLEGKLVLRLKGGDPTIFSNILDELLSLVKYQIDYEIIPGITAATGAAAYAGIPLTARNYANALRILTLHKPELMEEKDWKDLAGTDDTLVFYMSATNLDLLVEKLIDHGASREKYISVIEQGTTPLQRVTTASLLNFVSERKGTDWISPTLVIVGKVAALQEQFQWLPQNGSDQSYFSPLESTKKKEERA
jgi:uroporphyrin-III C-methyltransferase/precorrin-2 dehydrogenase/sirohydrochlorin ferrochelatase/uroporphyrin-III C-methyltransferase